MIVDLDMVQVEDDNVVQPVDPPAAGNAALAVRRRKRAIPVLIVRREPGLNVVTVAIALVCGLVSLPEVAWTQEQSNFRCRDLDFRPPVWVDYHVSAIFVFAFHAFWLRCGPVVHGPDVRTG